MRVLNERFADRDVDLLDGIKVFDERGWVQVLPDPDEPLIHIYAEGVDERGARGSSRRSSRGRGRACSSRRRSRAAEARTLNVRLTVGGVCWNQASAVPRRDERRYRGTPSRSRLTVRRRAKS